MKALPTLAGMLVNFEEMFCGASALDAIKSGFTVSIEIIATNSAAVTDLLMMPFHHQPRSFIHHLLRIN